ncbi:DUF3667 domain-containing protein [uncultured Winogradskyella sp.]|uniref:DUF3667 domain-containing protein n=1 Tax=uncultured Winogradskyella sp. TaxID=395353 RepID=UPI002602A998|nr:DUF3667 domain-containing protein [uncultured Winogradskyella sp.]
MDCKNCHKSLKETQRFCDDCGAKIIQNRLTPKVLAAQLNQEFISIDNKFLKTFINLFTKPELVIDGYIHGTRKKYINVVQYLAISITLLGLQYFIINSINPEYFVPESSSEIDKQLAKYYPPEAIEALQKLSIAMNEYMSLVYLLGLPISALISWIVFLKERVHNFTEHMVINMYVTAQYIIYSVFLYLIFSALNINISTLLILASISYVGYFSFVFYRIYELKISTIFLRFLYSIFCYLAIVFVMMLIAIIAVIFYMKVFK